MGAKVPHVCLGDLAVIGADILASVASIQVTGQGQVIRRWVFGSDGPVGQTPE